MRRSWRRLSPEQFFVDVFLVVELGVAVDVGDDAAGSGAGAGAVARPFLAGRIDGGADGLGSAGVVDAFVVPIGNDEVGGAAEEENGGGIADGLVGGHFDAIGSGEALVDAIGADEFAALAIYGDGEGAQSSVIIAAFAFGGVFEDFEGGEIAGGDHAFDPGGVVDGIGFGEGAVVIIGIHLGGEGDLALVAHAKAFADGDFAAGKGRDQERRENGDDGDDDEQFDEGEAAGLLCPFFHRMVQCRLSGGREQCAKFERWMLVGRCRNSG